MRPSCSRGVMDSYHGLIAQIYLQECQNNGAFPVTNTHGEEMSLLRLQLGVPVKVIHPAFMQVIGRKQPPVLMQVIDTWLEGFVGWPHMHIGRKSVRLAQIAA